MDTFVYKDHKKLRCGYTTGTCAAIAAQGAVRFLLTGSWKETEDSGVCAGGVRER